MYSKENQNMLNASSASGTANGICASILDELLPVQTSEHPFHPIMEDGAIRYSDIKVVRVAGKRAVLLPSGKMLGKALNRKAGRVCWVPVGRKEVA